jgi:putative endonuclease
VIKVYVLRSVENRRRYVGITDNLPRRLTEHGRPSSTVGRQLGPFALIHTEEYPDYAQARVREKFLKSGKGREWLDGKFG